MSDLRDILTGHGHNMFQYIKCLIDQAEKDGRMYSVQWVLYGTNVIGQVYTMLLCQTRTLEHAKSGATRAIGLYIEFITQLSLMDTCTSGSYTPYTIGCKDAAQFVYKKIFPDAHRDYVVPDLANVKDTNDMDNRLTMTQFDISLETLHEYKQIIQNMIHVLFSKERFYDNSDVDGTTTYYSDVISRLLDMNNTLAHIPIHISVYRHIVSMQCDNNNNGVHTERMSPQEYSDWIIKVICQ